MKPFILLFCAILFVRCSGVISPNPNEHTTSIGIIKDQTDSSILSVFLDPILTMYQFPTYPDAEAWCHLACITDKKMAPSTTLHLLPVLVTEKENADDDPQFRAKTILSFYNDVRVSFAHLDQQFDSVHSLPYSECWATICNSLTALMQDSSKERILFVFSDLFEKSSAYNAYKSLDKMSPEKIAAALNKSMPTPPNLKGMLIYIVYQPRSRIDDARFALMLAAYRLLLEPKGAKIIAQANNSTYTQ